MRVKRIARWTSHDYDNHDHDDNNLTWLIIPLCESKGSPEEPPVIMTIMIMIIIMALPGWSYHYASQRDRQMDLLVAKVWSPFDWLGLRERTCQPWYYGKTGDDDSFHCYCYHRYHCHHRHDCYSPFSPWYDGMLVHPWWGIIIVPLLVCVNYLGITYFYHDCSKFKWHLKSILWILAKISSLSI